MGISLLDKDNSFELLAKGYTEILHSIIDSIEINKSVSDKKSNLEILIKLFGWFLEHDIQVPERTFLGLVYHAQGTSQTV